MGLCCWRSSSPGGSCGIHGLVARVCFTQNLARHVRCPDVDADADVAGATVREVLDAYFAAHPHARSDVLGTSMAACARTWSCSWVSWRWARRPAPCGSPRTGATRGSWCRRTCRRSTRCASHDARAPRRRRARSARISSISTHALGPTSPSWPGAPHVAVTLEADYPEGYFARHFSAPEHAGTHVDAPAHFVRGAATVDALALTDAARAGGRGRRARAGGEERRL